MFLAAVFWVAASFEFKSGPTFAIAGGVSGLVADTAGLRVGAGLRTGAELRFGSGRLAAAIPHCRNFSISSAGIFREFWNSPQPGTGFQGGIEPSWVNFTTSSAHAKAVDSERKSIGPIPPSRWHSPHRVRRMDSASRCKLLQARSSKFTEPVVVFEREALAGFSGFDPRRSGHPSGSVWATVGGLPAATLAMASLNSRFFGVAAAPPRRVNRSSTRPK